MRISQLIAKLEEAKREYGDVGVSLAQLQANGKTVRLTGCSNMFGMHNTLFLTNMNHDELMKHLED